MSCAALYKEANADAQCALLPEKRIRRRIICSKVPIAEKKTQMLHVSCGE